MLSSGSLWRSNGEKPPKVPAPFFLSRVAGLLVEALEPNGVRGFSLSEKHWIYRLEASKYENRFFVEFEFCTTLQIFLKHKTNTHSKYPWEKVSIRSALRLRRKTWFYDKYIIISVSRFVSVEIIMLPTSISAVFSFPHNRWRSTTWWAVSNPALWSPRSQNIVLRFSCVPSVAWWNKFTTSANRARRCTILESAADVATLMRDYQTNRKSSFYLLISLIDPLAMIFPKNSREQFRLLVQTPSMRTSASRYKKSIIFLRDPH